MTRILKLTAGATMLMLVGCMTWQPTKNQAIANNGGKYSIQLPAGWNVLTFGTQQMVTRYGMGMQQFVVGQTKNKGAFGFGKEKSDASPEMDPRDLCTKVVANMKIQPNHETLEITSVAPALLGGRAGFRAELTSKRTFQADGIRYKHLLYGVVTPNGLYTLHYEAPVLYYFDKDVAEVEKSVSTFKLM